MKPELEFFFAKARRSLDSASLLRAHGDHDFAASRAYYAMFYVAEALLLSLNQSYSSHSATIGAFGREFAKTAKLDPKFHSWFIAAEHWRKAGDYDTCAEIPPEKSEELCVHAGEFIEAAERLLNESDA